MFVYVFLYSSPCLFPQTCVFIYAFLLHLLQKSVSCNLLMSAHGSGHQHCWWTSQWIRSDCKMLSSFEYLHCNKSVHTVHHVNVLCTHAARTPLQEKVKLYSPVFKINSFSHSGFMSRIYIHIYAFYHLARCRSNPQMYINWIHCEIEMKQTSLRNNDFCLCPRGSVWHQFCHHRVNAWALCNYTSTNCEIHPESSRNRTTTHTWCMQLSVYLFNLDYNPGFK